MVISSRRTGFRWAVAGLLGRLAIGGGLASAALIVRSPWWAIAAVVLLGLGVWLTVIETRAQQDVAGDEALEAAAEYDRAHPVAPSGDERPKDPTR